MWFVIFSVCYFVLLGLFLCFLVFLLVLRFVCFTPFLKLDWKTIDHLSIRKFVTDQSLDFRSWKIAITIGQFGVPRCWHVFVIMTTSEFRNRVVNDQSDGEFPDVLSQRRADNARGLGLRKLHVTRSLSEIREFHPRKWRVSISTLYHFGRVPTRSMSREAGWASERGSGRRRDASRRWPATWTCSLAVSIIPCSWRPSARRRDTRKWE